jgi:predicted site-specific integrase-resolvase
MLVQRIALAIKDEISPIPRQLDMPAMKALFSGADDKTIKSWVAQGKLPQPTVFGRKWYFDESEVRRKIEEHRLRERL